LQGRPTCGPEIFLCGPNWIQNSKKKSVFWPIFLRFLIDCGPKYEKKADLRPKDQLGLDAPDL
jgi:hypothetical protein